MSEHEHRHVHVRVYGDLQFFTGAPDLDVPIGLPRTSKDLLESVGIPHPEIDLVVVNGAVAGFDRMVTGGDRIAAYPPWEALDLPSLQPTVPAARFVLDVHLGTLARRLLVLGLDTDYATDRDDATLADIAVREDRVLLTRDRQLLMRREVVHGYCPRSDDPDEQVLEVVARFVRRDDLAPFTRCTDCNRRLEPVDAAEVHDQLEPHTRATHEVFHRCPQCARVVWPGTHVDALAPVVAAARAVARHPKGPA